MFERLRERFSNPAPQFDPRWTAILRTSYAHWTRLTSAELERMEGLTARFHAGTNWEAANGFELSETMKVSIAAQASMLLLGLELDGYPQLTSVIVHPSTVVQRGVRIASGNVRSSSPVLLSGEAHYRGPVILSWSAVDRGARYPEHGENVVYHEFAHQLDMLDGITDGTPPLGDDEEARQRWVRVCTSAFDAVRSGGSPLLRPYAGTNPAEFFAVATEVFFNTPEAMLTFEPDLYSELAGFYGQDPAAPQEGRHTPSS
jgi:Mlc titration factor MtfA (ptsG expression regulator)